MKNADNTYRQLRNLFDGCVDLPDAEREHWIEQHVTDADQRIELELMLAADRGQSGFLKREVGEHIELLSDAAAPEFDPETLIGRRFGAFALKRLIGQGGQGTVYLADRVDNDFAQSAAVKLLRRGIHDKDEHRRFRREREILARFEHAGVARLIDGGVSGEGVPYLIMEYVEGVALDQWCTDQALGQRARVTLFGQLCEVVAAAHRALIVHRDIKPSNVLVTPAGEVKVLDFGIARLLDEDESKNQTAVPIMTPGYGAPEQARGGAITLATDVHALGMLLRVLITGSPPPMFPAELTPLPAVVPPELRWIIGKACAMESERRYRDATEMGDDIARFLSALPVLAHPPSRWYVTRKFINRHRGGVLTTVAVILGILASAGVAIWQAKMAREQAQRAEAARDFLLSIFEAAREDLPADARPTPDVLANAAARRLEDDITLSPDVRAEFLGSLAVISHNSADYGHALEYSERALALLDANGAANSRAHLAIETTRANALLRLGKASEADQALSSRMLFFRLKDDAVAVDGLSAFANARVATGHMDDAVKIMTQAADLADRLYGTNARESLMYRSGIGFTLASAGRTQEAAAALQDTLMRWQHNKVPFDRTYATLLLNLAVMKNKLGDPDEALRLIREGLEVRRRIYGRPHEKIADALQNLGVLLGNRGDYDEAAAALEESASIYSKIFDPVHPQNISALTALGGLENKRQRYERALLHLQRAATVCADKAQNAEPSCINTWLYLTDVYLRLQRLAEADAASQRVVEAARSHYGTEHGQYALALSRRAAVWIAQQQPAQALPALDEGLSILVARTEDAGLNASSVHSLRAKALHAIKRYDDALISLDRATDIVQRLAPKDDARRLGLLALRSDIFSQLGRADEARDIARKALALEAKRAVLDYGEWERIEALAR